MSSSYITIIGQLGRDPENKNGVMVFSIAVDGYKNKETYTQWYHCNIYEGTISENKTKYLCKGKKILACGELSIFTFVKNGEKRMWHDVKILSFSFVGSKEKKQDEREQLTKQQDDDSGSSMQNSGSSISQNDIWKSIEEEEVPF